MASSNKYFANLVLFLFAAVLIWAVARRTEGFDEIRWQGQTFKLKGNYHDYEDYKDADDPLVESEVERVKAAMLAVKVPKTTPSLKALIHALRGLRFPGYGSSYDGNVKDEQGNRYILHEYEIPQKKQQRTLLYRIENDGSCREALDGVSADHDNDHTMEATEARVEGGYLRHYLNGKMYREIPLDTK